MSKKIAVDKTPVRKPTGTGLRSQIIGMPVNGVITLSQTAIPKDGESAVVAAIRTSKELRNKHSRSVTDARQTSHHTYTTSSSRKWENGHFVCSFEIIRTS